ncbi:MAG: hypothetical protein AAF492_30075, partial [Verrucomicrobiota bacterium]
RLKAYDRENIRERADQLALKQLAEEEKQISQRLREVIDQLKEDAAKAEETFPKACQSANDLADAMSGMKLPAQGERAVQQLLMAQGETAYQMAHGLYKDLESLFEDGGQCKQCQGQSESSLDQYLKLKKPGSKPGDSYGQMAMCLKFGNGEGEGVGMGLGGAGFGEGPESGYSMQMPQQLNVLGNEPQSNPSDPDKSGTGIADHGAASASPEMAVVDATDQIVDDTAGHQESRAVLSETTVEAYRHVVDQYIRKITTEKRP